MTDTPAPLSADSLREHYKEQIKYVLETSDESGEVRITYADGHSEIKLAEVLLLDDIMHFVDAYIAAALQAERQRIADSLPEKKSLETDMDDSGWEEGQKFCVECGAYEFEGILDCRCVGFNDAIEAVRAVLTKEEA